MNNLNKIILGNFLIEKGSFKKWRFVTVLFVMAVIMIFSSHLVDKKIISIADIKYEISILESEFLENRKTVMRLRMESNVLSFMKLKKIKSSINPPNKIIVN